MIHIPNTGHEAALNLAAEEYILTGSGISDTVLFFYINAPSVIIGRHQNAYDEIDRDYAEAHGIQIVRRCSGGGAVYHDTGNLNYSFITPGTRNASADFSTLLRPILEALRSLGLPAELSGRNDLTLRGAKFSGNAYYHNRSGSVVHGTILFDSDLDVLGKVLRPDPGKLSEKGVRSVRSRVCCIKNELKGIPDTEALQAAILDCFNTGENLQIRELSDADRETVSAIADRRYRNDSWTYGASPVWNVRHKFRTAAGRIDFRAEVSGGTVRSARFFGDFFCAAEIENLEKDLTGISWQPEVLKDTLCRFSWQSFFPDLPADEFADAVFSRKADE